MKMISQVVSDSLLLKMIVTVHYENVKRLIMVRGITIPQGFRVIGFRVDEWHFRK